MKTLFAFLLIVWAVSLGDIAFAKGSDWVRSGEIQGRILSGVQSIGDAQEIEAALQIQLDEGWHTYWKVSGDSGLPPRFDWSGSQNVESVEVFWPAPKRKQEADFYTFGYDNSVSLPLVVRLKEPNTAAKIHLNAQFLICKDICIPQQITAEVFLEAGDGKPSEFQSAIERAKRFVPADKDTPRLKVNTVVAGPDGLVLSVFSQSGFEDFDVFPTSDALVLTLPPEISVDETDPRSAMVRVPLTPDIPNLAEGLKGQALSVTVVSGGDAIEKIVQY